MDSAAIVGIGLQADVPILLWGPPGCGKSAVLRAISRSLAWKHREFYGSLYRPEDIGGYPAPRDDKSCVDFLAASFVLDLCDEHDSLLVLDEINHAPVEMQRALFRVVLDRIIGQRALGSRVRIAACANPPDAGGDGLELLVPLANRFCHLPWEPTAADVSQGFLAGWPEPVIPVLPEGWRDGISRWKSAVGAFLRTMPDLARKMPTEDEARSRAWPSSRTWDMAAVMMAATDTPDTADARTTLVCGCVGEGASIAFIEWVMRSALPDPWGLLRGTIKLELDDRGDRSWAILSGVASTAITDAKEKTIQSAWGILVQAAKMGFEDIAGAVARSLLDGSKYAPDAQVLMTFKDLVAIRRRRQAVA